MTKTQPMTKTALYVEEYLRVLAIPPEHRATALLQRHMCDMRDIIAKRLNLSAEETQNAFEALARMRLAR